MQLKAKLRVILTIFFLAMPSAPSLFAFSNEDCLVCHGDSGLTKITETGLISLFVDGEKFSESQHGMFECTDCHSDIEEIPHQEELQPVNCGNCHSDVAEIYDQSVHGTGFARGEKDVATCQDCHGSHYIRKVKDPEAMVYPLNLPAACGKCHGDQRLAERHNIPVPDAYQKYLKSVHGKGVLKSGLLVSATCTNCHGSHDILPETDPNSKINRRNISTTCGGCHAGITKVYETSIHGSLLLEGDENVPVCIHCHSVHTIARTERESFKLDIILECGECHEELIETYRESYHGQVTGLGYSSVARCSDCHGFHDVLPASDPGSTLSRANIVSTCQKCHPSANGNFVKFLAHADPRDKEKYPVLYYTWNFMTTLLVGVFAFFGIHLLLWFLRSLVHRMRYGRQKTV